MMLASLIILTFWVEIHTRCIELTKSATGAGSLAEVLLSKPSMYPSPSPFATHLWTLRAFMNNIYMYTCSIIFTALLLGAGHLSEVCQASCPSEFSRYFYNIVVILWLLQCAPFSGFLWCYVLRIHVYVVDVEDIPTGFNRIFSLLFSGI
jgi:hypothetical protein